jgi:hypothetical protein
MFTAPFTSAFIVAPQESTNVQATLYTVLLTLLPTTRTRDRRVSLALPDDEDAVFFGLIYNTLIGNSIWALGHHNDYKLLCVF